MQAFAIMRALTYLSWQSIATYTHQKNNTATLSFANHIRQLYSMTIGSPSTLIRPKKMNPL